MGASIKRSQDDTLMCLTFECQTACLERKFALIKVLLELHADKLRAVQWSQLSDFRLQRLQPTSSCNQ